MYEGIIIENDVIAKQWRSFKLLYASRSVEITNIPKGISNGVAPGVYREYRRGRDSACVDIVLVTRLENARLAVLLSLRKKDVCYEGKSWIYGVALQAYLSIEEFISSRATSECGIPVRPKDLIGVYCAMAEGYVDSTLQSCYATRVPIDVIRAKMKQDQGHSEVKLFTQEELPDAPE